MPIEAARVAGQFGDTVEDAHAVFIGQHRQGPSHVGMRHRVVVPIKTHVRRLGHRDIQALAQGIDGCGQPEQEGLLDSEGLAHVQGIVLRPGSVERAAPAPSNSLRVEIVDIGELARGEEALANEVDMALDPPLLIAPANRHRARLEAVVGGEGEEFRVEANRVAHAFEHNALEVVVEQGSSESAKCAEGLDVTTLGKLSIWALRQKRRNTRRE